MNISPPGPHGVIPGPSPDPSTLGHLNALVTSAPPGHGVVLSGRRQGSKGGLGRLWDHLVTADNVDQAAELVANLTPDWHVYVGTCTLSPDAWAQVTADPDHPKARGGAAHVSAVTHLWADLDVAGPGHSSDQLPPTIDDALNVLATLPQPSYLVSTGGGLHAYWQLSVPLIIDDDDSRAQAAALTGGWNGLVAQLGAALGWHVDNVADLSRVMRLCGTHNPKTDPAQPVQLMDLGQWPAERIDAQPWQPGITWHPDELRRIVDSRLRTPEKRAALGQSLVSALPTAAPARHTGPSLDILDSLEHLPWDDIWPPGWQHVGDSTIKGTPCQLWRHPAATSDYSAKCTQGVAVVFTDSLPNLPSNGTGQGYNRAQIMAWRMFDNPNDRTRLAKAMAAQRRKARQARPTPPAQPTTETRP